MFKNLFKDEVKPIIQEPEDKPKEQEKKSELEVDNVIFDAENPVVITGVQVNSIKSGWKNCEIKMLGDGVIITTPGYQPVYVHRSKTRQIYFK